MNGEGDVAHICDDLLPATTVRIYVDGRRTGSGFFVDRGAVVTCKHVVKAVDLDAPRPEVKRISARGRNPDDVYHVKAVRHKSDDKTDLAVLRVEPGNKHPCALLHVGLDPGDEVHGFGYTALHDEGVPVTLEAEGLTGDRKLFKLKEGRVEHGMSGSPLVNVTTGAVCAVLKRTIDDEQAAGGFAIPITSLFALSDAMASGNRAFHASRASWVEAMPAVARRVYLGEKRAGQLADPPELTMIVRVAPRRNWWEVTAKLPKRTVGPERVELNNVRIQVARLFRDWASPESSWRGRVSGEEVRLLGTILATAVLPGRIRREVERVLTGRRKGWVQIILEFTGTNVPPDLEYLPWEHLFIEASRSRGEYYLAREPNFAFARGSGMRSARKEPPLTRNLSVLMVSARPQGSSQAEKSLATTVKSVTADARELFEGFRRVSHEIVEPDDTTELQAAVSKHEPAVLHYVGHGRFLDGSDEIAVGDSGGETLYVPAATFSALLAAAPPAVVVLQLCDAYPPMDRVRADTAPFAPAVLARGVHVLVAYQYPAAAEQCTVFNKALYERLVLGAAVERAVQDARDALWEKWTKGHAFLAPTVAIRGSGAVRLTTEASGDPEVTYSGAASGYG
ncbi:MAG TPA: serine protease [Thermoleophilaceae bacterium]|jgi:hypothetical protein